MDKQGIRQEIEFNCSDKRQTTVLVHQQEQLACTVTYQGVQHLPRSFKSCKHLKHLPKG